MPDKGWHRTFDDPIPLSDGSELRTLRDAGNYIARLPKREHDAPARLAAIQALMLVVEHGGDTMLPRIGIMRARCIMGTWRRRRAKSGRRSTGSSGKLTKDYFAKTEQPRSLMARQRSGDTSH
jgi:hypothetical protein